MFVVVPPVCCALVKPLYFIRASANECVDSGGLESRATDFGSGSVHSGCLESGGLESAGLESGGLDLGQPISDLAPYTLGVLSLGV